MRDRRLPPMQAGHHVHLLQGWDELFPALVEAIARSEREVRLETYIFAADTAGEQMVEVLAQAARRGVAFRGGMTFCPAEEAGESVGRCEDWACRPAHRT